ncbi:MAG: nucleotide exchange factor GrpE, partial [Clostridia bacterium]|nr:nucleotide exchange factor GrpE [Clostridia bacterium]
MEENKQEQPSTEEVVENETQPNQEQVEIDSLSKEQLVELAKSLMAENQSLIENAKKADEYKDSWLRARADFENFKKRNNETRRLAYEDGKNDVLKSILLIGDNLDRALLTIRDEQTKKGIEMVIKQYGEILKN